jgi:rfaE bifunctional protein nucleotidyltransferase chain/domain
MKRIIVNGTFDIIHRGHIELLNYAKSLGDYLMVCIDTDTRVSQLKGRDRPVKNQGERQFILENIRCVNAVLTFSTDESLEDIIKTYQPDIMVKGSDYKDKPIVGSQYCKEIIFFDRIEKYATTKTIQNIIARR